jgi:hypothetical protein
MTFVVRGGVRAAANLSVGNPVGKTELVHRTN